MVECGVQPMGSSCWPRADGWGNRRVPVIFLFPQNVPMQGHLVRADLRASQDSAGNVSLSLGGLSFGSNSVKK